MKPSPKRKDVDIKMHNSQFEKEVRCIHGLWVGMECKECESSLKSIKQMETPRKKK